MSPGTPLTVGSSLDVAGGDDTMVGRWAASGAPENRSGLAGAKAVFRMPGLITGA